MKLTLLFVIIIVLAFCSPGTKSTTLILCSKSKDKIDSVKISGYGFVETFKDLHYNDEHKRIINIKNTSKHEGAFTLLVFQKDSIVKATTFGYYSKPAEIRYTYKVCILDDFFVKEETLVPTIQ